jgi:prevent-host-death family protein
MRADSAFESNGPADPHEVASWELRRATGRVLDDVRERGRMVVTKHGRPVAFLLSIGEALETVLPASQPFVSLRAEAQHELAVGDAAELSPWVVLSRSAAAALARLHRMRRGRMRMRMGVEARLPSPRHVETPTDVALCEKADGVLLVYVILAKQDLVRHLVGPTLEAREDARWTRAVMHGRWHGRRGYPYDFQLARSRPGRAGRRAR